MKITYPFSVGLICVSLNFSSAALAQTENPLQLELGGFMRGYVAVVEQDEAPGQSARSFDILRDTEIHFSGKYKYSDALTAGIHIETRADGGDTMSVDESYVYFSGNWGKLNFGAEDGAPFLLQVAAPSADSNIDGVSQYIQPINYDVATGTTLSSTVKLDYAQKVSGKADKLTYITPVYSGFQAAVSWTPELQTESNQYGVAQSDEPGDIGQVYEAALVYKEKIGAVEVNAGGGFSHGELEAPLAGREDRRGWNLGLNLSYGGYSIGAGMLRDNNGRVNGDVDSKIIGVSYETGPYLLGATYLKRSDDSETPLGLRTGSETDSQRASVGVTYTYGPGMSLRGSAHYTDFDSDTVDGDGTALLLGTMINF